MSAPATLREALTEIDRLNKLVDVLRECLGEPASSSSVSPADRLVDHEESARILRELVNGTDPAKGGEFFSSLVRHLASALKTRYAVVWRFADGRRDRVRTLAVWAGDKPGDNFEVPIPGSPCAHTIEQRGYCAFPGGVRTQFPEIELLRVLGVDSYFAAPMFGSDGQVSGNLVVMHDAPRHLTSEERSILELFAARAGAELGRQDAEQALKRSEAHFRALIEQASDVVTVFSVDGTVRYQSPSLERTMGYRPEERIGRSAFEQMHPDDVPLAQAAIREALEHHGTVRSGEFRLRHRDGSWRTLEIAGRAAHDAEGTLCIIVNMRDVTERKQAEEAVRRQRQDLLVAQALANLGSWKWDIDTGEVVWSDEQYRIFGHEPGSTRPTYEAFFSALLPDDHDRVLAALNDALAGTAPYNVEFRIVRPSGEVRTIHGRGTVIRNTAGHPVGMEGTVLDITDRKRTEEALRASEERWQLAARGSHDGIWDWDIRSGEVFFSSRWKAMRGYEEQESTGSLDEWRSRIHPDDLQRVLFRLERYLARQCPEFCEEYRVERKDGSYMWVLDRGQALWDEQGIALRMAGSKSDITERKQAEHALRESEARYRMLVDLSPSGIFVYCEGKTVYVNQAACRMLGAESPDVILDRPTLDLVHPDYRAAVLESANALLTGGQPVRRAERKYLKLDGTVIEVEVEAAPITWAGKPAVQGMFADITDRKRAEDALRASEDRYRILYDETPTMYFTLAIDGTVRSINRFGAEQLGYSAEELVGRSVLQVFHEADRDAVKTGLAECLAYPDQTRRWEFRKIRKDGSVIWVRESVRVGRASTGETIALVSCEDVTDRRVAEAALQESEVRYRMLVECSPSGVFVFCEGRIAYLNQMGARLLGASAPEEITDRPGDDFIHPDDRTDVCEDGRRILTGGESIRRAERRYVKLDGTVIEVEVDAALITWNGKSAIQGVFSDITARKRAEEAVTRGYDVMKSFIEHTPAAVAMLDRDLRYVAVSRRWLEDYRLGPESLIGRHHYDVFPEIREMKEWQAIHRRCLSGAVERRDEDHFLRADGSEDWLRWEVRPWHDASGDIGGIIIFTEVITERKRAERERRQREELLALTLNTGPACIKRVNAEGIVLHMNPAGLNMIGACRESEAIGCCVFDLVAPEHREAFVAMHRDVIAGSPRTLQFEIEGLHHQRRWMESHAVPFTNPITGCTEHLAVTLDITDRKQTEALQQAQERVLELVASGASLLQTLDTLVRLVESQSDGMLGSILLLDEEGLHLRHGASPNLPEDYTRAIDGVAIGPSVGSCGTAAFRCEPVFVEDIAVDPLWERYRDLALPHGLRACWSIPIVSKDQTVLGTFAMYYREPRSPNPQDLKIIEHAGRLATIAIERMRAEKAIRAGEERYARATAVGKVGVWELDVAKGLYHGDANLKALFGYSPNELSTDPYAWLSLVHAEDQSIALAAWERILAGVTDDYSYELRMIRKDGGTTWTEIRGHALRDGTRRVVRLIGATVDITERHHAQMELQRTKDHLQAVIRSSPLAVVTVDTDGLVTSWNAASEQLFGWSESDVIGKELPWMSPGREEACERFWLQRLEAGGASGQEVRRVRRDGSPIDLKVWSAPVRDAAGAITHWVGFLDDVTELKQVRSDVERSERQLRTVLDTLPVGVWFTDVAGRVLLANPAGRSIWEGVSKVGADRSTVGGGWWEHVGPLAGPHRWALASVLTKGESSSNETLEIECRDGSRKTIRNSAVPVRAEDGHVLGAIVLNEDITDRIKAEQALRQQHTLLSAIMDASIDIVYVKDLEGRYVHMNRAGATILSMPVDDVVGWDDVALWGRDLAASCRASDRRVLESGGTVTLEEVDTSQGKPVHYLTTKAPYRDPEGRIIGIIGISRDITQQKLAEIERERRYAELHAIFGMTLALSRASTLEDICQKALDGVEQALKCDRASILLLDQQGVMRFVVSRGLSEEYRKAVDGHSPWPHDAQDPQPLLLCDTATDPSVDPYRAGFLSEGIRAAAFIPLKSPEGLLGMFTLFYHEPHEFTENEIGVAQTIAGDVAHVIQRAKAGDALRLSEERFAKAFRASLHPLVIAELDTGMVVEANDAAYQLFGYRREEVEGRTTVQVGIWPTPEDRARFVDLLKREGSVRNLEVSLRMKTGVLRRCLLSSEIIELHGRRCMVTVGNDITERRRAEEQLRQSHAFIRQVIDTDPNFIFAKDREGRFALANKAVADAYGTTVDNLIGKTDADFNPNREAVEFFRQKDLEVMDLLQDRFIPEEVITDAAGRVRWLQTFKRPILDEQGRAIMVLGASTDITERKRMEEELRQRERDLRNALEEREQISQDLHDGILQSLYAIGLSLETCRPLLRKLRAKKITQTLNGVVTQLNAVMGDVRAFIAGLETELWRKQDLASAIRTMVQTLAQPHETRYRVSIDPSIGRALTPEQGMHLFSIVKEAMSNSLRHANAKHATVSLRHVKHGIRLTVSDNGVGFVPSRTVGTGHGLANMASRASRVGGTFFVHSRPKHGTRIILDLPKEAAHV